MSHPSRTEFLPAPILSPRMRDGATARGSAFSTWAPLTQGLLLLQICLKDVTNENLFQKSVLRHEPAHSLLVSLSCRFTAFRFGKCLETMEFPSLWWVFPSLNSPVPKHRPPKFSVPGPWPPRCAERSWGRLEALAGRLRTGLTLWGP